MELTRKIWKTLFLYKAEVGIAFQKNLSYYQNFNNRAYSTQKDIKTSSRNIVSTRTTIRTDYSKPSAEKIWNALATTDELSSHIGLAKEIARASSTKHPYVDELERIQWILFNIKEVISKSSPGKEYKFESKYIKDLEDWTAEYANGLPAPEDYIIPGGGKACASLHIARSICRRTEQSLIPLVKEGILNKEAQIYLNRLSTFLFTVSRIASRCDQQTEKIYIPPVENSEPQ